MSKYEKLKKIAADQPSHWLEETGKKLANKGARKNARKVALRVLQMLHEKDISQTELAKRMGVSRQQVSKIVKGQENFTFETIDKLEKALGVTLMKIEQPTHAWVFEQTQMTGLVIVPASDEVALHNMYRLSGWTWAIGMLPDHPVTQKLAHFQPARFGCDFMILSHYSSSIFPVSVDCDIANAVRVHPAGNLKLREAAEVEERLDYSNT